MATPSRGLARERHTGIKAAAAATAVGGFVAAWLGFANSHGAATVDDSSEVLALAPTLESTAAPTPTAIPTASVAGAEGSTATAESTAEPAATPTVIATAMPQSRISRGS
jgi:hypothetical protein